MTPRTLTLDKVIAAAFAVADRDGFDGITLTKTAKQLAVQPQSLYRYVKNTQDLQGKVLAQNLKTMVDQVYEQLIGLTGPAAVQRYMEMLAFGDYTLIAPHDYGSVAQYMTDPEVAKQYQRLYGILPTLLETWLPDEAVRRRANQLLADYSLGESVAYRNNNQAPDEVRRDDYRRNVAALIDLLTAEVPNGLTTD
ncbi:TetR/AcrR family transcriptional regulator [Lacticaseibacillus brantae]|nr:TetR/AcrR family transcriptional regulator [Lacticaseibacillus brantae]